MTGVAGVQAGNAPTPVGRYRAFGAVRLMSGGDARWHEPAGEYAYIEMEITDVQYNVR